MKSLFSHISVTVNCIMITIEVIICTTLGVVYGDMVLKRKLYTILILNLKAANKL